MTPQSMPVSAAHEILDATRPDDAARVRALHDDSVTVVVDTLARQREALEACLPRPDDALLAEPPRWVHLPWRRTVVQLLGPRAFRRVRLDRNRNKITLAEQESARATAVGVVGLSVGHAVAHTLALEGLAGTLRLVDFDELDLGNLNRVPATVLDIGVNKAVVTARRIAEIDPYVSVEILPVAIDESTVDTFLDGLDVVVEECDSFAAKVLVRRRARDRGIPVLCETSDGGVLDVERFDTDPGRPLFHGLLDDLDIDGVLDPSALIGAAATLLDARRLTARMGASVLEVGRTLSTWPQLGGDVALGGATCAAAVRRLVRGEPLPSGRIRIDLDGRLDEITDPAATTPAAVVPPAPDPAVESTALSDVEAIVHAAGRAPSSYNLQPWVIRSDGDTVALSVDTTLAAGRADVARRASAVALGAAAHNMAVMAAARGRPAAVAVDGPDDAPLVRLTLPADRTHPEPAALDTAATMLRRSTTRVPGTGDAVPDDLVALLRALSSPSGTVRVITDRTVIDRVAAIAADDERTRALAPALHAERAAALREPGDASPTGLPVGTLGLPPAAQALAPLLARPDVMAHLGAWDAGQGLGAPTAHAVASASALVVVTAVGWSAADFVRAGIVAQAVWVAVAAAGPGVCVTQPIGVYARDDDERRSIAPDRGDELCAADRAFRDALGADDTPLALVLRIVDVPEPAPPGRRRPL